MAITVFAQFCFTEDEFENLPFEKQAEIIDNMLSHKDWDVEIVTCQLEESNWED